MENKKEIIEKLYFQEKMQLCDIAEKIGTSVSYVSKILRKNANYNNEKEKRKLVNLSERREKQKNLIYGKRKNKVDLEYVAVKNQHVEATKELSKTGRLGDLALRKWCSSVYKYNPRKKRYEFNAGGLLKPADFPSYIKA